MYRRNSTKHKLYRILRLLIPKRLDTPNFGAVAPADTTSPLLATGGLRYKIQSRKVLADVLVVEYVPLENFCFFSTVNTDYIFEYVG